MDSGGQRTARGYVVAVLVVLAAALFDAALMQIFNTRAPIIALLLPVIIAAVFGGIGPGMVATLLGTALAVSSILPSSGGNVASVDAVRTFLFLIEGGLASWLIGSRQRALEAERRAIRNRSETETRYQELVENVNSVILRWSRDGTVTFANRHAEALFGYRAEDLVGQSVGLLVPSSDSKGTDLSKLLAEIIAQPERYLQNVNENLSRDGRRIWVLWTNRPVKDEQGNVVEILSIGSDVTKLKEGEEALRDADRKKNAFLAVLGHELRNPLAPLHTGLELLEAMVTSKEQATVIATMQRQLAYLVHLVDDLLDLARISRGKIGIRMEDVDLRDVIDAAAKLVQPRIEQRGHVIVIQQAEQTLPVHGDFHRLTQVVGNVLDNAAKYTDPGGSISLTTEVESGTAVIRIRDTGFGIPEKQLEEVFEMFSQVEEHRVRRGGGDLGIGLAVARQLCTLHGGSIQAESDGLGFGAQFTLRLPLQLPVNALTEDYSDGAAGARRRRIIVVDDNADAAETLRLVLVAKGHVVEVAHDGIAALKAVQEFAPDVVVLDIGLPDMDGYEVARNIRQSREGKNILLIALTGWGQPDDKRRAWDAGFDEHLTKPVRSSLLTTLIAAESLPGGKSSV